jgi:dipeptidyl aminopeptidase/acylaminoacyl peptidase
LVFAIPAIGVETARGQVTATDYRRAESFLPSNAVRLFSGTTLVPNWLPDGDRFWYRTTIEGRAVFYLVDPSRGTKVPAFDHRRISQALGGAGDRLPFDSLLALEPGRAVTVPMDSNRTRCDLRTYHCVVDGPAPPRSLGEVASPDGKWVAFIVGNDIAVRSADRRDTIQLSRDGSAERWYGRGVPSPLEELLGQQQSPTLAFWAPDSRRLATYRIDIRGARRIDVVQYVRPEPDVRQRSVRPVYPLPGDSVTATAALVLFTVPAARQAEVPLPPVPVLHYNIYPTLAADHWWSADSRRFYYLRWPRSFQATDLAEVDPETGVARIVARDQSPTFVERYFQRTQPIGASGAVAWPSERDGWRHLYAADPATGELARQLTRGQWTVRELLRIEGSEGWLFFTAGGRELGRDPYYRHLYRTRLDGSGTELLTPESADHFVTLSPSGKFFVDTYGTLVEPSRTVVRSTGGGRVLVTLELADLSGLTRAGWRPPRQFRALARDGRSEVFGILVLPTQFDSTRSYPIVDFIYAGPQSSVTPKTLGPSPYLWQSQALAELGFVVMVVDGMGTPFRSKAFHDVTYRNLGDAGLLDHIAATRELARRYPFIDTTRVGIFGISAGGYASTHAILTHPEFYKVAVSAAGNHDHRLDKAGWVERYMGPLGPHYAAQANPTLAGNLTGKLLLAHGDTDENVPFASTLALADALVRSGKQFDLLILPNRTHALDGDPQMIRRRWDFFVRHLLGVEPPTAEP